jgi:hypothetical protein
MAGHLRAVAFFLALACAPALAQQPQQQVVDPNFQALLNALMQGTPVTLLTPLPDGTIQVTSFTAPGQRSATDAAALIQRASTNLANFGVTQPTGQQLAAALAGGPLTVPSGSTAIASVVPGATMQTQVVNAANLPTVVAPSPAGVTPGQAVAGGSAASSASPPNGGLAGLTSAQPTQALLLAQSQLASLGISQPTPQQVAAMLNGGTVTTPAGTPLVLPGLLSGHPAQAPIVSPLPPPPVR